MGNLSIEMGIERANVILIGVNVQLRFGAVEVARFAVKDLELFGRYRGVKVLVDVTGAEFLRRIAIGTGTIFRAEVVEVVRIADFGVVGVQTPDLIDNLSGSSRTASGGCCCRSSGRLRRLYPTAGSRIQLSRCRAGSDSGTRFPTSRRRVCSYSAE